MIERRLKISIENWVTLSLFNFTKTIVVLKCPGCSGWHFLHCPEKIILSGHSRMNRIYHNVEMRQTFQTLKAGAGRILIHFEIPVYWIDNIKAFEFSSSIIKQNTICIYGSILTTQPASSSPSHNQSQHPHLLQPLHSSKDVDLLVQPLQEQQKKLR